MVKAISTCCELFSEGNICFLDVMNFPHPQAVTFHFMGEMRCTLGSLSCNQSMFTSCKGGPYPSPRSTSSMLTHFPFLTSIRTSVSDRDVIYCLPMPESVGIIRYLVNFWEIIYLFPQTEKSRISELFRYLQPILLHSTGVCMRGIFVIWVSLVQKCPN